MSGHTYARSSWIAFLFGFAVLVAFGATLLAQDGREAPLRTAELSIPHPELPNPPTTLPRSALPPSP